MLNRCSTIRHAPSGVALGTPLLIPSFSSKGFARSEEDGKSEVGTILAVAGEFLTEAYLISAYDVYYGHVATPENLPAIPELLFLDSGGYEISTDRGHFSAVDPAHDPWDREKWQSVVSSCPQYLALVIVSYDHPDERVSFRDQVSLAREGFRTCRDHVHTFLLKPETRSQVTLEETIRTVIACVDELGSFDIVGVTEKELGHSMIDRMVNIARLRLAMDEAGVSAPLHVFGALDPLSVCLYYLSGAEIFDGLTWMRYGYEEGRSIYAPNFGVIKYGIHYADDLIRSRMLADNLYRLSDLQRRLTEFTSTGNFEILEPHGRLLSEAWDLLHTEIGRRF